MSTEKFFILISNIRQKLLEAEPNSLATLPKIYRSFDSFDASRLTVATEDFFWGLENYNLLLKKDESNVLP